MKYRVAVVRQSGVIESINCETLEKCYDFLLKEDYKKYRIKDRDTNEIIETERNKKEV